MDVKRGIFTAAVTDLRSQICDSNVIYKHIKIYAASGMISYKVKNCCVGKLIVTVC
jgi:hypothetical protein